KGMLRNIDVTLDIANNGFEAIKKAQEKIYDVILMDIEMPEMDGVEATRQIRNLPKPNSDVPIIAITAHTESQKVETFLQSGMNDFIPKPVEKNRLFSVINSLIQSTQNNKTT
ncbi:MAG: response regulator, partial [Thermodesulfovibrionales bacterium]|nr:response regulator [Thermodesulfovibrionales bacterium]